jgi:hypothetical protein
VPTDTWTWISAFITKACLMNRTVRIKNTNGTTSQVGIALKVWFTMAFTRCRCIMSFFGCRRYCIGSTMLTTNIFLFCFYVCCCMIIWYFLAVVEGISMVTGWTRTNWIVANSLTQRISSTNTRTRILTLLINTCFI